MKKIVLILCLMLGICYGQANAQVYCYSDETVNFTMRVEYSAYDTHGNIVIKSLSVPIRGRADFIVDAQSEVTSFGAEGYDIYGTYWWLACSSTLEIGAVVTSNPRVLTERFHALLECYDENNVVIGWLELKATYNENKDTWTGTGTYTGGDGGAIIKSTASAQLLPKACFF